MREFALWTLALAKLRLVTLEAQIFGEQNRGEFK